MKLIAKFSLITAAVAVFASISASADDQQLTNRLAIQRTQASATTTVAVYASRRGVGSSDTQTRETHLAQLSNGHGTYSALYR